MVVIDNDASAMAHAILLAEKELRTGVHRMRDDWRWRRAWSLRRRRAAAGQRGGGIEFGHIPLTPDGPQCRCGSRGCVESFLADYALLRDAMAITAFAEPIRRLYPGEPEMQALTKRADEGERPSSGSSRMRGACCRKAWRR